jgi:flavin-dependent dehydrogenase
MASFDVLVIGGGPAGASAALLLARAGRSVAVIEKSAFPRRKVCGEYIAPPAASFLRSLGVPLRAEIRRISVWGSRSVSAPLPAPYASTLAREDLDAFLLKKASEAGAAVFQPLKAASLMKTADGFLCESIEARTVVAAHGSWEPGGLPTQHRHRPPGASDLLAFKAHFHGADFAADTIALIPFPGGYGGVLMLGEGRATFACCIRRDALEALRRPGVPAGESVFRHALRASAELKRSFEKARTEEAWLASGPLRPGVRHPYREGIYAVGNAAGEVHPIVGQGISLALQSAALLSATFDMPLVYERECRKLYARALWPSSLVVRLTPHARAPWMLALGARLATS